jgi:hypothetical protein
MQVLQLTLLFRFREIVLLSYQLQSEKTSLKSITCLIFGLIKKKIMAKKKKKNFTCNKVLTSLSNLRALRFII